MITSSVALIIREKRILLIKRSNYTKNFPHYWALPGWRWEPWETPEEVVVREIKEELWVDFNIEKLFIHQELLLNEKPWSVNRFVGNYKGKLSMQEEEIDGYAWYTYKETQDLKIWFNHADVIKKAFDEWFL